MIKLPVPGTLGIPQDQVEKLGVRMAELVFKDPEVKSDIADDTIMLSKDKLGNYLSRAFSIGYDQGGVHALEAVMGLLKAVDGITGDNSKPQVGFAIPDKSKLN